MAENNAKGPGLFKRIAGAAKAGLSTAAAVEATKGGAVLALHGLGFGKAGVVAKSVAAGLQAGIATANGVGVVKGSAFAVAQSVGSTAAVVTPIGAVLITTAVAVNVGPAVYRACKGYYGRNTGKPAGDDGGVLVAHADAANGSNSDAAAAAAAAIIDGDAVDGDAVDVLVAGGPDDGAVAVVRYKM